MADSYKTRRLSAANRRAPMRPRRGGSRRVRRGPGLRVCRDERSVPLAPAVHGIGGNLEFNAGPLAEIVGDRDAIRVHAADYDTFADFLRDETAACVVCGTRWYQRPPSPFDADIYADEGVLVCEDCAPDIVIEGEALRGWGRASDGGHDSREHGTLYARNGAVVG